MRLHFMDYTGQRIYEAFYNALEVIPAFSGWKKLAIAESPTKHNLTLLSGFTGSGSYYKDQFGRVTLNLKNIAHTSGTCGNGTIFAYLPAGFCPTRHKSSFIATRIQGNERFGGELIISEDGSLRVDACNGTYLLIAWTGEVSFLLD